MSAGDNITLLDPPVLNDLDYVEKHISCYDAIDAHDHTSGKGLQIPSGGIEDDAIETSKIKDGAVTNAKLAGSIDLTAKVTGVLPAGNGGTGFDGSAAANGELAIGNGSGFSKATLTGTSNQVTVTNGSGTITLSGPQDLAVASSPTFVGSTYSGLTASRFVVTDGAKALASQQYVDVTSEISGSVPINNGGTGQTGATAAFNALSPLTTSGDMIAYNGTDAIRIAVGIDNTVLTADSAVAGGVKWAAAGGGGGGGGGGSVVWNSEDGNAPVQEFLFSNKCWSFGDGLGQSLYTTIKVPSGYVAGSPISMKINFFHQAASATQLLLAQTTLIPVGTAFDNTTNQRTTTNTAQTAADKVIAAGTLDLADSSGEINAVAVGAGDLIKVRLYRGTDDSAVDVSFIESSTEVTFS